MLATYVALAMSVWGPAHCGTPTIVTTEALPAQYMALTEWYVDPITLEERRVPCTVYVDQEVWKFSTRVERCTILLHEWGHLVGRKHTDHGIMRPEYSTDKRCAKRFKHKRRRR